jgi:hypothetical protein
MKKLYTIILFASIFFSANAQTNVYQPFPNDSAVWFSINTNGTNYPPSPQYNLTEWLGDTVINSIHYTKQFSSQNFTIFTYSGGIRQDIPNEKIFHVDFSGVEHDISFNQHLVVGDTFPTTSFYTGHGDIISRIDSILIGTKYHKEYIFKNMINNLDSGAYLVGVGDLWWTWPEGDNSLSCFSVDNINLLGGAPYCQVVSVSELSIYENSFTISPNPTNGKFQINNNNLRITGAVIYNVYGEKVFEKLSIINSSLSIDLSQVPDGIYFLQVKTTDGVATKKIVVSK